VQFIRNVCGRSCSQDHGHETSPTGSVLPQPPISVEGIRTVPVDNSPRHRGKVPAFPAHEMPPAVGVVLTSDQQVHRTRTKGALLLSRALRRGALPYSSARSLHSFLCRLPCRLPCRFFVQGGCSCIKTDIAGSCSLPVASSPLAITFLAAGCNIVPVTLPLFPPVEGSLADDANFGRQPTPSIKYGFGCRNDGHF